MRKIGIIGFGKMGKIRAREIDKLNSYEVVAVADIDPTNMTGFKGQVFTDWKELLEMPLDAVVVSTFNDSIVEAVCASLDKGLHVFSEKPPGRNLQECRMIEDSFNGGDSVLKFGFNHRYHGSVMAAEELIRSGKFGKVLWAKGTYGKAGGPSFKEAWRSNLDSAGGGILLDQGIHMADLLCHFLGPIDEVKGFTETLHWDIPMEDNAFVTFNTSEGQLGFLHSSATYWKNRFELEVNLEGAMLRLEGILSNSMTYAPEKLLVMEKDFESEQGALGFPRVQEMEFQEDCSWELEMKDFIDSIEKKRSPHCGTIGDALRVMEFLDSIYTKTKQS
ncbi:MAG: oxidoreductase [Bdellovibrionaceae bacterium]|nr:oxidoreductase [Pseudobdellovibrionaceae bacterium]|tara:strand:+ start:88336 stop:89334 length:999 start_codon:yes stop_codon:yes gene_type:complete